MAAEDDGSTISPVLSDAIFALNDQDLIKMNRLHP